MKHRKRIDFDETWFDPNSPDVPDRAMDDELKKLTT
jgi:hypothetical protein